MKEPLSSVLVAILGPLLFIPAMLVIATQALTGRRNRDEAASTIKRMAKIAIYGIMLDVILVTTALYAPPVFISLVIALVIAQLSKPKKNP